MTVQTVVRIISEEMDAQDLVGCTGVIESVLNEDHIHNIGVRIMAHLPLFWLSAVELEVV